MDKTTAIAIRREIEDSIATRELYASKTVLVPVGFIGGAIAGAGIGSPGGPPGAVIGAIVGAIIGLISGAAASDPLTRWLTSDKKYKLFCMHLCVDHQNHPKPEDVRKNYRCLMKQAHPDHHRDAPDALAQKFKKEALEHSEAY